MERCQDQIDETNRQRNKHIEDVMWMSSHTQFNNSYGKKEETAKSKLFNIYHLTSY